jgi:hypothetical protein
VFKHHQLVITPVKHAQEAIFKIVNPVKILTTESYWDQFVSAKQITMILGTIDAQVVNIN